MHNSSSEKTMLLEDETYRQQSLMSRLRMNTLSKVLCLLLVVVGLLLVSGIIVVVLKLDEYVAPYPNKAACQPVRNEKPPRNLIFFVGDGFGQNYNSFARIMNGGPLSYDKYLLGQHYTQSADNVVTDSAAGATAFSTGYRTNNEYIATLPNKTAVGTLLEAAVASGRFVTGVVTNDRVSGATPSSFMAHSDNRDSIIFISNQLVTKGIDLILGGGKEGFTPAALLEAKLKYGYNLASTKQELATLELPILGLFAQSGLPFLLDRTPADQAVLPTVDEMVQFGLEILEKKATSESKGIILIVENGKVDISGHQADAAALLLEVKDLSNAFQRAINFSLARKDTLVLLTADHETGGQAVGNYEVTDTQNISRILEVKKSTEFISNAIQAAPLNDTAAIMKIFTDTTFITSLTQEEWNLIYTFQVENSTFAEIIADNTTLSGGNYTFAQWIGTVIARRCRLAWTTRGHTAQNVNVYGYGPRADQFCGMYENRQIGERMASVMGLDLQAITDSLKDFNTTSPQY